MDRERVAALIRRHFGVGYHPDHVRRFTQSAGLLKIALPLDPDGLAELAVELTRRNAPTGNVYYRPYAYKAGPDLGGWVSRHGRERLGGRPFGDGTPPPVNKRKGPKVTKVERDEKGQISKLTTQEPD